MGHAHYSPSSADGWTRCSDFTKFSGTSEAAALGTAKHSVSEECLRDGKHPTSFIGQKIVVGEFEFTVDDEFVEHVSFYVDHVNGICGEVDNA